MWLESFLCLTGLGTDSLRVKTLNDNPYVVYDVGDRRLTKNKLFHLFVRQWWPCQRSYKNVSILPHKKRVNIPNQTSLQQC